MSMQKPVYGVLFALILALPAAAAPNAPPQSDSSAGNLPAATEDATEFSFFDTAKPGLNVLQARRVLWENGYSDVRGLTYDQGNWRGKAKKNGADVEFEIDRAGAMKAAPTR